MGGVSPKSRWTQRGCRDNILLRLQNIFYGSPPIRLRTRRGVELSFNFSVHQTCLELTMSIVQSVQKFIRDEEGAVAIEYALVAAGIAGIVAVFFSTDSQNGFRALLTSLYSKISTAANKTS